MIDIQVLYQAPMTVAAGLLFIIWSGLVFGRYWFWWPSPQLPGDIVTPEKWPCVVAVVPARNEAETVEDCLTGLLAQKYPGDFRIVLANDASTDDTGLRATKLAKQSPPGKLSVFDVPHLKVGWAGKMWALHNGILEADSAVPDYYWFTDADIRHGRQVLAQLVMHAEAQKLAMASLMVRLKCKGFWEKILVPAFIYYFALLYPFRAVNRANHEAAAAAGGCILIRRDALEDAGGIAAIRNAIIDDCSLAGIIKDNGHLIWLGFADDSESLRGYAKFGDFWNMVKRSAYTQLGYSPLALLLTLAGLACTHFVPPALAASLIWEKSAAGYLGLATYILMSACYLPMVWRHGLSPLRAFTLPLAAALFFAMTFASALNYHTGKEILWRGRPVADRDSPYS